VKGQKNKNKAETRDRLTGTLFFLPWLIGFFAFTVYPVIYSVRLSFSNVLLLPGKTVLDFVGGMFYDHAWNVDTVFKEYLGSAVMLIGTSTPVIIVFSLIIAILLNSHFRGRSFFRVIYFLPVIIMSGPAISKLLTSYTVDFSSKNPEIFSFLDKLPGFINSPAEFILNHMVLILWFSGVQIIVFLSGLQKISPSLYEAAAIDGADGWERFWKITLPHIAPLAMICAVYTIVDVSNYSNLAVNTKITAHLFDTSRLYSFSAAMSWIYFIVLFLILGVVFAAFYMMSMKRNK
jgi:ABC-type sugar transport system permease subunit